MMIMPVNMQEQLQVVQDVVDNLLAPQILGTLNFAVFKEMAMYPILLGVVEADIGKAAGRLLIEQVFNRGFVAIE